MPMLMIIMIVMTGTKKWVCLFGDFNNRFEMFATSLKISAIRFTAAIRRRGRAGKRLRFQNVNVENIETLK